MSNLFAGVYGAKFPEVVMNSGPLPPEGGLPAPLHDTPDSRINYGSTLLGDLQPYAYGEAGYMSSQSQNNQPHRIQKIIPELHLPEPNGLDTFKLSHAVDDSDLAFVMRLNRNSIFCTGTRGGTRRNTKVGTTVDPIINLPTLNYLLAGLQVARPEAHDQTNLWWEFLHNLDPAYWSTNRRYGTDIMDVGIAPETYQALPRYMKDCFPDTSVFEHHKFREQPFTLDDIVHFIRHCVKPFGIVRGSEKQGGQHEMSLSAVTWTAPTIATLVIDGKEANVVNIWHYHDLHAGEDLVLRLKLMPVKTFTLNHYFKGFSRKTFEVDNTCLAWQLVPDVFTFDLDLNEHLVRRASHDRLASKEQTGEDVANEFTSLLKKICKGKYLLETDQKKRAGCLTTLKEPVFRDQKTHMVSDKLTIQNQRFVSFDTINSEHTAVSWQQLGYWHIGRTQVARPKYGTCEFYSDDMANSLKTNHIDMTFQPHFGCMPRIPTFSGLAGMGRQPVAFTMINKPVVADEQRQWTPQLGLETFIRPRAGSTGKRLSFEGEARPDWQEQRGPPAKRATFCVPAQTNGRPGTAAPFLMSDWSAMLEQSRAQLAALREREQLGPVAETSEPLAAQASAAGSGLQAPDSVAPSTEADGSAPLSLAEAGISESSRQELLEGLAAPSGKKAGRGGPRARKAGEGAASRGPVDGTLLRPGAEPEACRMELL